MRAIETQCVGLWQEAQAVLWMGRCGLCKNEGHAGHHIIPRGYFLTKFELLNGIYLCTPCHNLIEDNPAERERMNAHIRQVYPALWEWHEEMRPKAKQTHGGWSIDELKEIRTYLKEFICTQ